MELLECQTILKFKSRLFDIIDPGNGSFDYSYLMMEMVLIIKSLTDARDVALFTYKECRQQLVLEAATAPEYGQEQVLPPAISLMALSEKPLKRKVYRGILGFEAFDIIVLLIKNDNILGCLALKGYESSFSYLSDEVLEELGNVSQIFLTKAQNLDMTVSKEKRYRQLFRVTEKFHSSMNMDDVLGEIICTLQEEYPTFTYYLFLSHDNNKHGDLPLKDLEYDSENIAAMQAYVTGTIQFEDTTQEKRSILYAPLKGKQGVYGVLQVIAPNTLIFPNTEVEFITILANTAGSALENAQLYQQSRHLISDLQLINETSHRLNSNLRLTETISFMSDQIINSFGAEEVGFILFSDDHWPEKVQKGSTQFFHTEAAEKYIRYIKKKIKEEKESIFIGDFRLQHEPSEPQFKSIMAVPMTQSGILKGFVLVMHPSPYYFAFESFKLLQSLIHHSTLAFANSILREKLEKMVVTDHLTNLYSRSYLDEKIHQSMKEDREGTFILIDIDDFKAINDTFGHQVGDEVIIQVADLVKANIRGSDIGARWGGEELAIYLPGVSLSAGLVIAERVVKKVSEDSNPKVTISCGISYWSAGKKDSYSALFKRADNALYTAKQSGKNKVVVQEDDGNA